MMWQAAVGTWRCYCSLRTWVACHQVLGPSSECVSLCQGTDLSKSNLPNWHFFAAQGGHPVAGHRVALKWQGDEPKLRSKRGPADLHAGQPPASLVFSAFLLSQVLHPRTAGFVAAWEALHDVAKAVLNLWPFHHAQAVLAQDLEVQPPVLVDVTMVPS